MSLEKLIGTATKPLIVGTKIAGPAAVVAGGEYIAQHTDNTGMLWYGGAALAGYAVLLWATKKGRLARQLGKTLLASYLVGKGAGELADHLRESPPVAWMADKDSPLHIANQMDYLLDKVSAAGAYIKEHTFPPLSQVGGLFQRNYVSAKETVVEGIKYIVAFGTFILGSIYYAGKRARAMAAAQLPAQTAAVSHNSVS